MTPTTRAIRLIALILGLAVLTSTPAAFVNAQTSTPHETLDIQTRPSPENIWYGQILMNFGNEEHGPQVALLRSNYLDPASLQRAVIPTGVEKDGIWEFKVPEEMSTLFHSVFVDPAVETAFATSNLMSNDEAAITHPVHKQQNMQGLILHLCAKDDVCGQPYTAAVDYLLGCRGTSEACAPLWAELRGAAQKAGAENEIKAIETLSSDSPPTDN